MSTPPRIVAFFVVGLVAASQSGNLIRIGDAHPLAIAAWRLLLATLLLAPFARGQLVALRQLSRRELALLLLTGLVLAGHFWTWIAGIQMTRVANATSVLALGPVLTALGAVIWFRERLGRRFIAALGLGVAGVALIGAGDAEVNSEHLQGDLLIVLSVALFTIYLLLGRRLRGAIPNLAYVVVVYAVAAAACFAGLTLADAPLVEYSARNWLCFGLMALVPTVLGHTSINSALRYLPAGRVSLATLCEPPLAGLIAWWAWGEPLTDHGILGYLLISAAVVVLVREQLGAARRSRLAPAGR